MTDFLVSAQQQVLFVIGKKYQVTRIVDVQPIIDESFPLYVLICQGMHEKKDSLKIEVCFLVWQNGEYAIKMKKLYSTGRSGGKMQICKVNLIKTEDEGVQCLLGIEIKGDRRGAFNYILGMVNIDSLPGLPGYDLVMENEDKPYIGQNPNGLYI